MAERMTLNNRHFIQFYTRVDNKREAITYYMVLLACCMVYGLNDILDYCLGAVFLCLFLCFCNKNYFIFTYVALIFFESKLDIPGINMSILALAEVFYVLRLMPRANKCIDINKNKYTIAVMLIYVVLRFSVLGAIKELASIFINVLCIFLITIEYHNYFLKEDAIALQDLLLLTIALFSAFAGIYGFYNGVVLNYGGYNRYCGTIDDPNYSAFLYCIGFMSLYGIKDIKKQHRILLFLILLIDIVATVSMAGLAIFVFTSIIYLFFKRPKSAMLLTSVGILAFLVFLEIELAPGSALYGIQLRIKNILAWIAEGDFSSITSSRVDIAAKYMEVFNQLPLLQRVFGGNNTVSGPFREYMIDTVGQVSHNSYIDILFMHGYVGIVLLIGAIVYRILYLLYLYFKKKEHTLPFVMQKVVLLMFSSTLVLYPYRYYIFFMLL